MVGVQFEDETSLKKLGAYENTYPALKEFGTIPVGSVCEIGGFSVPLERMRPEDECRLPRSASCEDEGEPIGAFAELAS